jgi:hypothetical protein
MQSARKTLAALLLLALTCGLIATIQPVANAAPLADPVNPGLTGLVSWWDMDQTEGTRYDVYGTNHLTDNNTVGYAAGIKSNAASFVRANNEFLSRADNTSLSFGDEPLTITGWYYFGGDSSLVQTLVGKDSVDSNREYYLAKSSSDTLIFYLSGDGTNVSGVGLGGSSVSVGNWYFFAVWHDPEANIFGGRTNANSPNTASYSGGIYDGTSTFIIGARNYAAARTAVTGRLDEVNIWRRVLISDEIDWLYNAGAGRVFTDLVTGGNTHTPTSTNTATETATNTATNTATDTPTATNTATNTATSTATDTPTATNTPTDTATPTDTLTPSPTAVPWTMPQNCDLSGWSVNSGDLSDLYTADGAYQVFDEAQDDTGQTITCQFPTYNRTNLFVDFKGRYTGDHTVTLECYDYDSSSYLPVHTLATLAGSDETLSDSLPETCYPQNGLQKFLIRINHPSAGDETHQLHIDALYLHQYAPVPVLDWDPTVSYGEMGISIGLTLLAAMLALGGLWGIMRYYSTRGKRS